MVLNVVRDVAEMRWPGRVEPGSVERSFRGSDPLIPDVRWENEDRIVCAPPACPTSRTSCGDSPNEANDLGWGWGCAGRRPQHDQLPLPSC